MIVLNWECKNGYLTEDYQTNIFIAAFTTCWARLKLYDVLEMFGERVLYYDTDSVIFASHSESDAQPNTGPYLGQLTSELEPDEHIVHFTSAGPTNFSYLSSKSKEVCKIRGFTLNFKNSIFLNFRSMLDLVTSPNDSDNPDKKHITVSNASKISRNKKTCKIYARNEDKKYQIVYSKRVIEKDTYNTFSYGY
jgi:hypothetical protein